MLQNTDKEEQAQELLELNETYHIALLSIKRNNLFLLIVFFYCLFLVALTLMLGIAFFADLFSPKIIVFFWIIGISYTIAFVVMMFILALVSKRFYNLLL